MAEAPPDKYHYVVRYHFPNPFPFAFSKDFRPYLPEENICVINEDSYLELRNREYRTRDLEQYTYYVYKNDILVDIVIGRPG